jgi:hypothetical protein
MDCKTGWRLQRWPDDAPFYGQYVLSYELDGVPEIGVVVPLDEGMAGWDMYVVYVYDGIGQLGALRDLQWAMSWVEDELGRLQAEQRLADN